MVSGRRSLDLYIQIGVLFELHGLEEGGLERLVVVVPYALFCPKLVQASLEGGNTRSRDHSIWQAVPSVHDPWQELLLSESGLASFLKELYLTFSEIKTSPY